MKFEEAQTLNRKSRRLLAKDNGIKVIPGTNKPYMKPVKRKRGK